MNASEQAHFEQLYAQHLTALKLQGMRPKTIEAYARAVRRVTTHFERCPDSLSATDFKAYFSALVDSHSWSTVKVGRNGLQFFFEHVLERDWDWIAILKPPSVRTLSDILSVAEVAQLIQATRQRRFRVFFLVTYSLALRLGETLTLEIGDIDASAARVHVRDAKGGLDRFVPIRPAALFHLRTLWRHHRHPRLLFPNPRGDIATATSPMHRTGVQRAFKAALAHCAIHRKLSIHSLRHSRHPDTQQQLAACPQCLTCTALPHSCGHRSCPRCQHRDAESWLTRHRQQLLPTAYFLVTFTVPQPLRAMAFAHQRVVYTAMLRCAWQCLAQFAENDPQLAGEIGATAVLHTHNRRRDYHPHVHVLVPAGALTPKVRLWRQKTRYLFNAPNLGRVFRGKMRDALREDGLQPPEDGVTHWIVDCKYVSVGDTTLVYLARYLYRGVLSEHDILACRDGLVTFRYTDAKTGQEQHRTLPGADFLWLLLQHVLPKGFHRVRDFGLLHPRRATLLRRVQRLLRVTLSAHPPPKRAPLRCAYCNTPLNIIGSRLPPNPVRDGPTPTRSTWNALV